MRGREWNSQSIQGVYMAESTDERIDQVPVRRPSWIPKPLKEVGVESQDGRQGGKMSNEGFGCDS